MELEVPGKQLPNETTGDNEQSDIKAILYDTELLPEIFGILHDLRTGVILVKDFDKHAGSIRLKILRFKNTLQSIDGINESVVDRNKQIASLRASNAKKVLFLNEFSQKLKEEVERED